MRRLLSVLIFVLAVAAFGTNSYAQVSSAAVLFLRIAAGARAAGMGEAYVAVADDATATHWNPAGLGRYPLSTKWLEVKIPEHLRPLKGIALFRGEGPEMDYQKFDIWAISSEGLVRCKKDQWVQNDTISTKANQTVESILRQYTGLVGVSGEERIPGLIDKVGLVNNAYPIERIDSLEIMVMGAISEEYKSKEYLQNAFSALKEAYNLCLIDWGKVEKAFSLSYKGVKDSVLNEIEADKILFAVEKARLKYLPGEIAIPFDVNFEGELSDIAASNKFLWVASTSGIYRYNGENWQHFGIETGLPTNNFKSIQVFKKKVFFGSDSGLVLYESGAFTHYGSEHGLPELLVSAIAIESDDKAWVVVDDDLYQFDGSAWRNYVEYTDTLDQPGETIYQHMKIYDTPDEKAQYLSKYKALNPSADDVLVAGDTVESADSITVLGNAENLIDSVGVLTALQLMQDSTFEVKFHDPPQLPHTPGSTPRKALKIPFTGGLKFKVLDMEVDQFGGLWIGTEYGLLKFTGRKWRRYGYRDYAVETDITAFDLALSKVRGDTARAERLARNIETVNDLESDIISAGRTIKMYTNPAGGRINDIQSGSNKVIFATAGGTICFDGIWSRYNARNLGQRNTLAVVEKSNNAWFLTRDKIEVSAGARKEITGMHVNWLPELADDIYYEFLGYVRNVEGWGTVGANITFLSYGKIIRTNEVGIVEGEFSAFDFAFTLSFGTPLTTNLSGGISAKIIYSHLSTLGAGREKGSGTSTGLALDLGLLYEIDPRLTLGLAITNLGPQISYIDVSQADPLPRNLAIGIAWKMIQSSYNEVLFTVEANKSLTERDKTILEDFRDIVANPQTELRGFIFNPFTVGNLAREFKNVIINGGIEYKYGSFISFRGGYIHDEMGSVKTPTLGVGLAYSLFKFDFAYIPSSEDVPLANTMRFSLSVGW